MAAVKKNPLYRTVRLDKMVIAILEELILNYMKSDYENIPAIALLFSANNDLKKRAEKIQSELKDTGSEIQIIETEAFAGGGSLPEESFPSIGIAITDSKVNQLAKRLRMNDPPIIGRIQDDKLVLDIRTIFPNEDQIVIEALKRALGK